MIKKEEMEKYLFTLPSLIVVVSFLSLFSYIIYMSMMNMNPFSSELVFVGLKNYIWIFTEDMLFPKSFKLTILWVFINLTLQFILGFFVALTVKNLTSNRYSRFSRFRNVITTLILIPSMTAPIAVGIYFRIILNTEFGPLNFYLQKLGIPAISWLGNSSIALYSVMLTSLWSGTPLVFLLCLAGLLVLPKSPYEAAKIDGATPLQVLFYITLPLMKPIFLTIILLRFVDVSKVFDKIFVLTGGGPGTSTEILTMHTYFTFFKNLEFSKGAAIGVLLTVAVTGMVGIILWFMRRSESE
ncbi:MAG TPA: sugar ABC transporter permease [Atribacterota bacterium]|nr:sugar ABC transporter permease [Atribacterota bacterium]